MVNEENHLPTNLEYKKFTARDPLVIHWFDNPSFLRLIQAYIRAEDDMAVGQFIKLFRGFSSRAKAKNAREIVADARKISDLSESDTKALLGVMQSEAKEP